MQKKNIILFDFVYCKEISRNLNLNLDQQGAILVFNKSDNI